MGSPSTPRVAAVGAAAKQSSLDIQRAKNDTDNDMRRRRGYNSTISAGESVLG